LSLSVPLPRPSRGDTRSIRKRHEFNAKAQRRKDAEAQRGFELFFFSFSLRLSAFAPLRLIEGCHVAQERRGAPLPAEVQNVCALARPLYPSLKFELQGSGKGDAKKRFTNGKF
jgi:hypothetical protein